MELVCNGKKCLDCQKHYKQWEKMEKERLHDFLRYWVLLRGRNLTNTIWWEDFVLEWCEYFGYDVRDKIEFDLEAVKQFPFHLSTKHDITSSKAFWNDFLKCYSEYFYLK